jgi:exonuclease III
MLEFENLRVCTLNVHSITDDEKRRTLFHWLKQQRYDLIALQETSSVNSTWDPQKNNTWTRQWGQGKAVFSKHCAILINNPRLSYTFRQQYFNGRILAIDVYADDDMDHRLRMINIYVPCTRVSDINIDTFVEDFPDELLTEDDHPLVVLGDLNTVIDVKVDRNPPAPPNHKGGYSRWNKIGPLMDLLDVSDIAPRPRKDAEGNILETHFTHVATTRAGITMTRLDHIMVSQNLKRTVSGYRVQTAPIIQTDHRLVEAVLYTTRPPNLPPRPDADLSDDDDGLPPPRRHQPRVTKPVLILDTRILRDTEFQAEIRTIISSCVDRRAARPHLFRTPGEFWDDCKAKCLFAGLQYRKRKRHKDSRERVELFSTLKLADIALDNQPNHPEALDVYNAARQDLRKYETYRMDRDIMLSKIQWIEEGERASPDFTKKLKRGYAKRSIVGLKDNLGVCKTQQNEMEEIARSFYGRLYTSEPTNIAAQDTLLAGITKRVTPQMAAGIDKDITLQEIELSIDSMSDRSSPGSDGLPYEFYKTFKAEVAPLLLEVVNSVGLQGGHLPASHRKALTTLIFKKGDNELIQNYRPISLTQCDYKIFTKVLTNRINHAAKQVIGAWQTGFIPGRQGHDNVRMLELASLSLQSGDKGEAAILSLDQEKAYDRVEWSYMHRVLQAFGFGPRTRAWVRSCYSDLSATIVMNRNQSAPYEAHRGLRQGDPLAPLLFNFVLEPFLLYYERHASGIPTPGTPFKVAAFADDTTLAIVPGDEPCVLSAIDLHERASGAKINKHKTSLIPLTVRATEAITLDGFPSSPFNEPFTHLGVTLQAQGRDMKPIEEAIIRSLKATVANWQFRRLSFQGRVTVANTYLLSKLWHVAPFYLFSDKFFDEVDKLTKKILWNDSVARISLAWYRQPKNKGGWNLINPKTQCQALKAKWMARWQSQDPRWKPLFTDMARSYYGRRSIEQTVTLLETAPAAVVDHLTPKHDASPGSVSRRSVFDTVNAFAKLDAKRIPNPPDLARVAMGHGQGAGPAAGQTIVYAGNLPLTHFTVKQARKYIEAKELREWKARPTPDEIYLRPPIYKHLRFLDRKPWPDRNHVALPNAQWNRFFADRLHSPYRYTNERHHLYKIAHHVYQTNGVKDFYKASANPPLPYCRRDCAPDGEMPPFENRGHAFHDCPEVLDLWHSCRAWIKEMVPTLDLRDNAAQDQLCWPEVPKLPPVAIHLHASVTQTIFKTYCKLGDCKPDDRHKVVPPGVLEGRAIAAFRYRARTEWERAKYKDGLIGPDEDSNLQKFIQDWQFPPHIVVEQEGLIFGGIWSTDNTEDATDADAEPAVVEDDVEDEAGDDADAGAAMQV